MHYTHDTRGFNTRSLHAGAEADPATGSRATPIHQTTSFVFDDAETAAEMYALRAEGHIYSRLSNPTVSVLEDRIADLSGGSDAVATGSGMAAFDAITTVLASAGDNVVASSEMYGGTAAYLTSIANRRGVEARLVDTLDDEAYADAIDDDTAFVHVETVANPSLVTPDFERLAEIAHENAVPLVVDNTFATPPLSAVRARRRHRLGVDDEVDHGQRDDRRRHRRRRRPVPVGPPRRRLRRTRRAVPAYPIDFVERFGDAAFGNVARQRGCGRPAASSRRSTRGRRFRGSTRPARDGAPLRERPDRRRVPLQDDDRVDWVTYPGFEDHQSHDNAAKYLDGYGGMVTFGVDGGYEAAKTFCEAVDLTSFLANIGDAKTLVIHPASTTHAQMDETQQRLAGVYPEMLRLSVGIEDADDVIADLDQGLTAGERAATDTEV